MAVSEFVLIGNHVPPSRTYVERASALVLIVTLSLLAVSCGTVAQANNNSQSLALSGSLPGGAVQKSYNAVLSVAGGNSPYQFSISSGSLPPGLTLNPVTGSFTGQPTAPGVYKFDVMVKDSPLPDFGTQSFAVNIGGSGSGGGVSVGVAPGSVTLSSSGTQQFTASVTGTSNTAVSWTASTGSVNSSGLYSAPAVQSQTQATVTATSQADSTKSASASVTITSNQGGQSPQITTSGLPQGQQSELYNAVFSATGGTQPYHWSLTGGSLPAGVTLNANGDLSGTPTTVGTSSFTVKVTDAANNSASGSFGVVVTSSNGYDGPAQLPLATVPSSMADSPAPGGVISVKSGGDFQAALNSAQCGQTIQLQAGATFDGTFSLPAKGCNAQNWIIIRTSSPDSALPAEGQRLTPCYAGVTSLPGRPAYSCQNPSNVLAKIENNNLGPITLVDGANYYRFVGLEITRPVGSKNSAILISPVGRSDHIIVDRSWLHGQAQDETRDGISLAGGTNMAVIDSYFSDFHCIAKSGSCTDSHAISGGVTTTQDGPYLIQNNFLEAAGEAVMMGGGGATLTPTDITVTGNHFFKPMSWMKGNSPFVGGPTGDPFIVKNHLELKNAVRVLIEANLMENSWGGFTQKGHAILFTPKNQHTRSGDNVCPICQVTDVTLRYTQISHAGGGIVLATAISGDGGDGAPALAGARFSIHDIVMDDLSKNYLGGGDGYEIANSWPANPINTITINHTTVFPDAQSHVMSVGNNDGNPAMYGLVYTNNLTLTGRYPIWNVFGGGKSGCATGVPISSIQNCFTTNTFKSNGLISSPPHFGPSTWPANNLFPADPADVQFVNYENGNGGNYQLKSSSPYKNAGTDGKDLGADIVGLQAALAGVE